MCFASINILNQPSTESVDLREMNNEGDLLYRDIYWSYLQKKGKIKNTLRYGIHIGMLIVISLLCKSVAGTTVLFRNMFAGFKILRTCQDNWEVPAIYYMGQFHEWDWQIIYNNKQTNMWHEKTCGVFFHGTEWEFIFFSAWSPVFLLRCLFVYTVLWIPGLCSAFIQFYVGIEINGV